MSAFHLRSGPSFAGRRIGLLGGSFNPAHKGHLAISLFALKRLGLHEIWWLVSPQNPLKDPRGMASLEARLRSARAVAGHAKIAVTDIEAETGTRYTVDTLRALKARFPRAKFVWLMGADNLRQAHLWRDWEEIFRLVPVAVFRRPAYAAGRGTGKAARRFGAAWKASLGRDLALSALPAWLLLNNRLDDTSSTQIRGKRNRGKN